MTPTMMEPALTDHSGRVPVPATRLRTDHLTEAFGITSTAPRFSWTPPRGTVRQTAYRLQPATAGTPAGWTADVHGFVPYGGPCARVTGPLRLDGPDLERGRGRHRDAVRLGRADGRGAGPPAPGRLERPVDRPRRDRRSRRRGSALATPCTGISPWPPHRNRARAYATAHGIYELFINGQRVGDQQLTPGSTSYHTTLQVQAFDITPLLRAGTNTVRAVLTDGWFRGSFGFTRDADMYGTQTAFLAQLEIESGGARTVIGTDESWLVSATEIVART